MPGQARNPCREKRLARRSLFDGGWRTSSRPLPFPEPERIVIFNETAPNFPASSCAWLNYLDWRTQAGDLFSQFAAGRRESFNLTGDGDPERVLGRMATAELLPLTGFKPVLGRFYTQEEDKPGAPRTVVLTHGLWQRRFGSDPRIVGKAIQLSNESYTVVGVLPKDFRFLSGADLFVPLGLFADRYQDRGMHPGIYVFGRTKPGVTVPQVQKAMDAVAARISEAYPEVRGNGIHAALLRDDQVAQARPALLGRSRARCRALGIGRSQPVARLVAARQGRTHRRPRVGLHRRGLRGDRSRIRALPRPARFRSFRPHASQGRAQHHEPRAPAQRADRLRGCALDGAPDRRRPAPSQLREVDRSPPWIRPRTRAHRRYRASAVALSRATLCLRSRSSASWDMCRTTTSKARDR
jgi:MacB-like protein